uniref:SAM-dependent methyltransferase n=1 Tax=Heterorhabditis bacteriophora TaxID=37862 RepID=A0A1I7XVF5_HETBA
MGPELVRDSFVAFSAELPDEYHRVIKAKSSPRATSVSPATDAYVNNIYQMLAYDAPENFEWSVGEWCAFKGTNFCLGEALVANSYLPAWNSHVERV